MWHTLQAFSSAWFDCYAATLDVVFFATPHEFSADWAHAFVNAGVKVFDLSGGFRLKNVNDYPKYYGFEHANADALATSFMVMGKEKAIDFIASNPLDSIFCFMVYDSAKSLKEWSNF